MGLLAFTYRTSATASVALHAAIAAVTLSLGIGLSEFTKLPTLTSGLLSALPHCFRGTVYMNDKDSLYAFNKAMSPAPKVRHTVHDACYVEVAAVDHAARAAELRRAAEVEDERHAAQVALDAKVAKLADDIVLANVTGSLLVDLRKLVKGETAHVAAQVSYADYRKQLAPLAESYGYKLTLVGDKTKAALTVI